MSSSVLKLYRLLLKGGSVIYCKRRIHATNIIVSNLYKYWVRVSI